MRLNDKVETETKLKLVNVSMRTHYQNFTLHNTKPVIFS